MTTVQAPGMYDLTEAEYHRDPVPGGSLSSTGARKLLPPSCPALYRYWADHPQPPKRAFDLGHAAHRYVLGAGAELVDIDADSYRTKAAQQARDAAYDAGKTPVLPKEREQVIAMAAAVYAHPIAGRLLDPESGIAEQAGFWQDPETGVWCRAKFDFLRIYGARPAVIVDYKTGASAEPDHFGRSIHNFGYFQQDAWYEDGAQALGLDVDGFLFVTQEKDPPYLVTVFQLTAEDVAAGRARNRLALEVYRKCTATGHWPSYADDVVQISRPGWAQTAEEF